MKKLLFLTLAVFIGASCAHKMKFKNAEKMVYTEPEGQGLMVNITKTKVRSDEVHFDIALHNKYDKGVEVGFESFSFKYNGLPGAVSRNDFPAIIEPSRYAEGVIIFKFQVEKLMMPAKGELTLSFKQKDGKKLRTIKYDFDYMKN